MTIHRLKQQPKLRVVESEPAPDLSYEYRQRQHIASRDWATVHILADRRSPVAIREARRWEWR